MLSQARPCEGYGYISAVVYHPLPYFLRQVLPLHLEWDVEGLPILSLPLLALGCQAHAAVLGLYMFTGV